MSKESRTRLKNKKLGKAINNIPIPKQAIKITPDNCPQVVLNAMAKGDSGTINRMINQGSIAF